MKQNGRIILSVFRFDPDAGGLPYYRSYPVQPKKDDRLLDVLETVKEKKDHTLSYRRSCRHGICGSCAVRVNGTPVLACKINIAELVDVFGVNLKVDPLKKERVIRDLVIDMDDFWNKYRSLEPYLVEIDGPETHTPLKIGPEQTEELGDSDLCIQCGACYYVCPVADVNRRFLGPAAFTRAYRFVSDVRDFSFTRLFTVNSSRAGVWDCAKCLLCVEACPKGINPFEKITRLHELAVDRGQCEPHEGFRHGHIFRRQVRRRGYINEFFLALFTLRFKMIEILPRGIRLFLKGKLHFNYLFPRSTKRYELRNILKGRKK
jgi:succinate dehydrogenase / fumarate reductase iron-sulfur subunit